MKENIDMLSWDSPESLRGTGAAVTPPAVALDWVPFRKNACSVLPRSARPRPEPLHVASLLLWSQADPGRVLSCQNSRCVTLGMLLSFPKWGCELLGCCVEGSLHRARRQSSNL